MLIEKENWKEPTELIPGDFVSPSRVASDVYFRVKSSEHTWNDANSMDCYAAIRFNELEALISELMDFREWVIENRECESLIVTGHASDDPPRD